MRGTYHPPHDDQFKRAVLKRWNETEDSAEVIAAVFACTRSQILGIVHRAQPKGLAKRRRHRVDSRTSKGVGKHQARLRRSKAAAPHQGQD